MTLASLIAACRQWPDVWYWDMRYSSTSCSSAGNLVYYTYKYLSTVERRGIYRRWSLIAPRAFSCRVASSDFEDPSSFEYHDIHLHWCYSLAYDVLKCPSTMRQTKTTHYDMYYSLRCTILFAYTFFQIRHRIIIQDAHICFFCFRCSTSWYASWILLSAWNAPDCLRTTTNRTSQLLLTDSLGIQ